MTDDAANRARRPAGGGRRAGRVSRSRVSGRVRALFAEGGPGYRDLAVTQALSTAADTLVALGLANTLFFAVPSAEARGRVALYLLLTVAPFAVIGPLLGRLLDRTSVPVRGVLVAAAAGRAVLALVLLGRLDGLWLFPIAFGLLVLSRVHGITRNSIVPLAIDDPRELVGTNARLAWIGVLSGAVVVPFGLLAAWLLDGNGPLVLAAVAASLAALVGRRLPDPASSATHSPASRGPLRRLHLPRAVRLAQVATAAVRFLNGFLLLLLAFAFRDADAGLADFGALLAAAGGGFALAALIVPRAERRVREEPLVVAALALAAGAAFSAGQWFGLAAAAALAAATGVAWGTAKLAFDGLLQANVPTGRRGAAFTRSETIFSIAWVAGAILPTAIPIPTGLGLVLAGFAALGAQIVYVGALLVPPAERAGPDAAGSSRVDGPGRP